jgi:exodeoxyribonuclease-1
LPEGVERIPLKAIHLNKCPIIAPAGTLDDESAQRLNIDKQQCLEHCRRLLQDQDLSKKIQLVFAETPQWNNDDPDRSLYGGFFSDADKQKLTRIRAASPSDLAKMETVFEDARLPEMFFRYRARNFYETLSDEEKLDWERFREERFYDTALGVNYDVYMSNLQRLSTDTSMNERQKGVVSELIQYATSIAPQCKRN